MTPRRRPPRGRLPETLSPLLSLLPPLVLLALWLVVSLPGGLAPSELLGGVVAVSLGAASGPALRALRGASRGRRRDGARGGGGWRGEAWRGEAARAGGSPFGAVADDAGVVEDADAAVDRVLEELADRLGARRLGVWSLDEGAGTLSPERVAGAVPSAVEAAGSPLAWAIREGQGIRVEPPPSWALGPLAASPLPGPGSRVLVVEAGRAAPSLDELAGWARFLAPALSLLERDRRAATTRDRLGRVIAFLEGLPQQDDPLDFPDALARAARGIAAADGALVSSWNGEAGRVLARTGEDGGPAVGTSFGVNESDLALASRAGNTLRRDPRSRPLPLAAPGERWDTPPGHVVVIPLGEAADDGEGGGGALAVWSAEPLDPEGIALLEALAPLLALQLSQSSDLVRFRQRAAFDALTGLPNRGALDERLREERARFHRYRHALSVLVLDLDHFKRINDTYGHAAGDMVLKRVAALLQGSLRDVDFAARFGGEEMVVVLPETLRLQATEVAERIRAAIADATFDWGDTVIPVTASIGVSTCPECVDDPAGLIASADEALYQSKREGRNRVTAAELANAVS